MTIGYTKFNEHNYSILTFGKHWKWETFHSVRSLFVYTLKHIQEQFPDKEHSLIVNFRSCDGGIPTNSSKTTDMVTIGDFVPSPSVPSYIAQECEVICGLSGLFVVSGNSKYERVIKSMFLPAFEWDELRFFNNLTAAEQVLAECVKIGKKTNIFLEKVTA